MDDIETAKSLLSGDNCKNCIHYRYLRGIPEFIEDYQSDCVKDTGQNWCEDWIINDSVVGVKND